MKYWQSKLSDNKDLDFPDTLCPAVAKITPGFSFAYMQEAVVVRTKNTRTRYCQKLMLTCASVGVFVGDCEEK